MKINLNEIDRTQFMVHEHLVNGEVLSLVQPCHIGCHWNQDNKHFRSSVWNFDGELVSAGFPKFTNWGENPDNFPVPKSLSGATVMEKLDGSLLIVSKYKGEFILRTRGTVGAAALSNGYELEIFKQDYPNVFSYQPDFETWPFSLLFEWVSPVQRIVLNYGDEPDWYLVGGIYHDGVQNRPYNLFQQDWLDALAKGFGCKRPKTYTFNTVTDLMNVVDSWKGQEGVCVYANDGQSIYKIKSAWYLMLHHMKSELSSLEKVLDVWIGLNKPEYNTFYDYIASQFDFELANQCRGHISNICDAWKEVAKIETSFRAFVTNELSRYPTRKLQAVVTIQSYGQTNRASYIFKLLDGKQLADDDFKKLMWQVLKQ